MSGLSKRAMWGEFLREAAVLVLVFGLLDGFKGDIGVPKLQWSVGVVLVSGCSMFLGMRFSATS